MQLPTRHSGSLLPRSAAALLCSALLLAFLLVGCSKLQPEVSFDPSFSVNIMELLPTWPNDETELTSAEEGVLQAHGRPDYFHIMWSRRHEIISESVAHRLRMKGHIDPKKLERRWIYVDARQEVRFAKNEVDYEVTPLSDYLEVIVRLGDPEETRYPIVSGGKRVERWYYRSRGLLVTFEDGRLISEDDSAFPPGPGMMGM